MRFRLLRRRFPTTLLLAPLVLLLLVLSHAQRHNQDVEDPADQAAPGVTTPSGLDPFLAERTAMRSNNLLIMEHLNAFYEARGRYPTYEEFVGTLQGTTAIINPHTNRPALFLRVNCAGVALYAPPDGFEDPGNYGYFANGQDIRVFSVRPDGVPYEVLRSIVPVQAPQEALSTTNP